MFDSLLRKSDGEEAYDGKQHGNGSGTSLLKWQYVVPFIIFAVIPYILIFVLFGLVAKGNDNVTNNVSATTVTSFVFNTFLHFHSCRLTSVKL